MNTPTDPREAARLARDTALVHLLQRIWTYSVTTKSDDARTFADEIAEASSRGFITTSVTPQTTLYGKLWKITPDGMVFLFKNASLLTDEEVRYAEAHCTR